MITSSDCEYIETKKIKKGEVSLAPPFDELAACISTKYNVEVLNVIYDRIIPDDRPRLEVVLEWGKDKNKFIEGEFGNFNKVLQGEVKSMFIDIVEKDSLHQFECDKLFVIFSEFECIAKEEANSRVSDSDIDELKVELSNPAVWKIRPRFGSVTIFLYTDSQLLECEKSGRKANYSEKYLAIVKMYDEFGYINNISVELDSKENFENTFKGSWFNYDR
jgi:hypothetical protein